MVSPRADTIPVFDAPGSGTVVSTLPSTSFGDQTWVPALTVTDGWYEVQLSGPPNGASGWVRSSEVTTASTPWLLVVSLGQRTIAVYRSGALVGTWPAAVGAPSTPTPEGVTFIAGDVAAEGPDADLAPLVRPLGWHTTTPGVATEFPGGTIAIHGWHDETTDPALWSDSHGKPVSHGCVRLPADVMTTVIAVVPNATPVWIVS